MADISKVTLLNGTTYDLKDAYARRGIPYGVCDSVNAASIKSVSIPEVTELVAGLTVAIKFTYNNAIQNPQLKINDLDAKTIYYSPNVPAYVDGDTSGWYAGSIIHLTYDGEKWLFNKGYNSNDKYVVTSIWCNTDGNTATKVGLYSDYYTLKTGNVFECTMRTSNYKQSALYFSIGNNSKPLYINGEASSSTNYTLPAGKYLVYYDGNAYHFRTDGKQPISISGTVNGYSINKSVPSDAVFTDTTYTADTSKLVTTTVPNVTSVGSAPTLGTEISADDITSWTTNTPTSFTVTGEKLTITSGTAASLSYTEKSIPNVTSVGSAPTLGTAITVATGSLASDGGGGTVVTGITGS